MNAVVSALQQECHKKTHIIRLMLVGSVGLIIPVASVTLETTNIHQLDYPCVVTPNGPRVLPAAITVIVNHVLEEILIACGTPGLGKKCSQTWGPETQNKQGIFSGDTSMYLIIQELLCQ